MKKEEKFLNDCLEFDKKASIGTELLGVLTSAAKYTAKKKNSGVYNLIHIEYANNFLTIEANDDHQAITFCFSPEVKTKEKLDFYVKPEEIRKYKQGKIDYISTLDANNKKYPDLEKYYPKNDIIVDFKATNVLPFLKSVKQVNNKMVSDHEKAKQVTLYIKHGFDTDKGYLTIKSVFSDISVSLPVNVWADKDFNITCNIDYLINAIENNDSIYCTSLNFENDNLKSFGVNGVYKNTFVTKTALICPTRTVY